MVNPARTVFGRGTADTLLAECRTFGERGVLVHGASLRASGVLTRLLDAAAPPVAVETWECPAGEPTLDQLARLLPFARKHGAQWVAGVGGGSAMDLGKACAGLMNAAEKPRDYHDGAEIESPGVPFVAVPTTAGSGSEAAMVSVLTNTDTGIKKSFRHPFMAPRLVILDSTLLASAPRHVIAHSGMDALTQAVESYLSRNAMWLSQTLSLKSVLLVNGSLEKVYADPGSERADDLLLGAHMAGLALSYARLGIVHGLAHPLGERYKIAHGHVCGICLPAALRFNRETVRDKYATLCETVGGDVLERVEFLLGALDVSSPLAGQSPPDDTDFIDEVLASGSTRANPRDVGPDEIRSLLAELFEGH
jgi:alcohol dehydrogenase class IV